MEADIPKQYMYLGGRPLFTHAYALLEASSRITDIMLIVPDGDEAYAWTMLQDLGLGSKLRCIATGGSERCYSVAGALEKITWPCDIVYIHDGNRPFLEEPLLEDLYRAIEDGADGAIAAVPAKDTIKIADENGWAVSTPDRSRLWMIQTPQVFPFALIRDAYREVIRRCNEEEGGSRLMPVRITDDAVAAEIAFGARIRMVMASYRNLKITTREDMLIAETFLQAAGK